MTPARPPNGDPYALPAGHALLPAVDRPGGGDPTVLVPADDPPALNTRITPGALLRALRRCWVVAAPVGLVLAAVAAAGAWSVRPDKYTSSALLRILPASATRLLGDNHQSDGSQGYMRTQLALLRSRPVLQAALKDEKVRQLPLLAGRPDPAEWLEKELQAQQIEGTELIRLSLTTRGDGADLAPILKAVVRAHLEMVERTELDVQNLHLSRLQIAYANAEAKVRDLREAIRSISQTLKGGDPQVLVMKQRTQLDEYAALRGELARLDARKRELDYRLAVLKPRLDPPAEGLPPADPAVVDVLVERELDSDPAGRALKAAAADLKGKADRIAEGVGDPANPAVVRARERQEAAGKKLEDDRAARRVAVLARSAAADRSAAAAADRDARAELALLTVQREDVRNQVGQARAELDRLGLGSSELDQKRTEAERSEQFVKLIFDEKERLELELKGGNRQRVIVVSQAEPGTVLNPLGRAVEAAGAGAAGLFFGLLAVALLDARRGRIYRPADVARGLRLPVLGSLPVAPGGALVGALQQAGAAAGRYNRGLVESADALRTRLLRGQPGGRCPVLMVASPAAGEGKTTLAAQLAASLARAGYATLLVDGDLRRPSLHRLFGAAPTPGLCDLLAGEYGADAAVRPTAVENLHLLPAGALTPRASAGLAQAVVPALFDGLRARYDFVLVDSSPLLLVSDAFLLARPADGVILSVRPGVSQAADVYAAYQQLVDHHLPFTGVVVNGVPGRGRYAEVYGSRELAAAPADPSADAPPAAVPAAETP